MTVKDKLQPFPSFATDDEAEAFVATADLTEYDWSDMTRGHFEFATKDARVNMRLPAALLDAVKDKAAKLGVPYQRFIRQALEGAVRR